MGNIAVKKSNDKRDLIMSLLKDDDRNLSWLSKKTSISYTHLYHILVRKERELTEDNFKLIVSVLGVRK